MNAALEQTFVSYIVTEFGNIRVVDFDEERDSVSLFMDDMYEAGRAYARIHMPDRVHLVGGTGPFCGYCMGSGIPLLGLSENDVCHVPDMTESGDWISSFKFSELTPASRDSLYLNLTHEHA